jgi:diguanylate cyclase (GGDEF)-like protein
VDLAQIAHAHQSAQRLLNLTQELGSSLNLSETLAAVVSGLRDLVPHDTVAVYRIRDHQIEPLLVQGESARLLLDIGERGRDPLSRRVAITGESVLNGDPREDTEFTSLRSALIVHLASGDFQGAVALYRLESDAFSGADLETVLGIQRRLSTAIANALLFRQEQQHRSFDPLTGLPNARELFVELDKEIARGRRTGTFLALLTCDLHGFRRINERYGEARANLVLQEAARLLREHCREYDTIARTGPDEYALLLPDFPQDALDRKLEAVAGIAMSAGRAVLGEDFLEFAVGWASFPADGMDAESLMAKADARLFDARQKLKATPRSWMFSV